MIYVSTYTRSTVVLRKRMRWDPLIAFTPLNLYSIVGSQVGIHQSPTSSNMKKRVAEKCYKSKELVLELSPQLNRSLGCMRGLGSCVWLEGLQFLPEKLHYEGFAILVHKNCTMKGLQFWSTKIVLWRVCSFGL